MTPRPTKVEPGDPALLSAQRNAAGGEARLRRRVFAQLEPSARSGRGLSALNRALVVVILVAVVAAILQTEARIVAGREGLFRLVELSLGGVFAVEYITRIWVCVEDPRFAGKAGRLRYALTPGALIDLAVALVSLAPVQSGALLPLRLLRVLSILRFVRVGRFSREAGYLLEALRARSYELCFTVAIALVLIVLGATAMWVAEGALQPEKFGSIPRAMWWAAVTLTTIGYGDVFPVTTAGKLIAVAVALAGIGLIAMPAGILAAAFSDALQKSREVGARTNAE